MIFYLNWRSRRRSCQGWSWFIPDHLINFPPITGFACTPCQTFWFLGTQLLIEKHCLRSRTNNTFTRKEMYRVCQNNALSVAGTTVHRRNHHLPAPLVSGDWFFGCFLLRLSRIKRPQVMSMVKFSPIALNFGYDFLFGYTLYISSSSWSTT